MAGLSFMTGFEAKVEWPSLKDGVTPDIFARWSIQCSRLLDEMVAKEPSQTLVIL